MSAGDRLAPLHRWCHLARDSGDPEVVAIGVGFGDGSKVALGPSKNSLGVPDLAMLRMAVSFEARDAAVRTLAKCFGMGATAIAELLVEYERTRWPSMNAAAPSCPSDLLGTPQALLANLRARPRPLCERQVRRILEPDIATFAMSGRNHRE